MLLMINFSMALIIKIETRVEKLSNQDKFAKVVEQISYTGKDLRKLEEE